MSEKRNRKFGGDEKKGEGERCGKEKEESEVKGRGGDERKGRWGVKRGEKRARGTTQGKKRENEKRKCLRLQLGREKVEGRNIKFFFTKN